MTEKLITKAIIYFEQPRILVCDAKCYKAWGINNRPKVQLSDSPDDYEFLADHELGTAPADPGTYEGQHSKPEPWSHEERLNKWCARECERSRMIDLADLKLPDFSQRRRNMPVAKEAV